MENKLRPFSWTRQAIEESAEIPVKNGCFAVIIVNISAVGGSRVLVEGFPINAPLVANSNGESWSIGGVQGTVISKSTIEIVFTGAVAGDKVFIQQAFYTDLNY